MDQNTIIALQRALQAFPNLDPRAVMAIASHEGLSGGIGDNGTSYGPFQLHLGGAYPSFAPHGSPQQDNAWAWSPQGLQYALSDINRVAGGLKGLPAITAISTKFERPANPSAEIADAARHYGGIPIPSGSPAPGVPGMVPGDLKGGINPSTASIILSLVNHVLSSNGAKPIMIGG